MKALGVLLTTMAEDLDTDLWIIGSIGTLHFAWNCCMTPLAAAAARKLGGRRVVTFGGALYGVGLVMASTTYSIAILAVSLVLVAGTGAACTHEVIRAELVLYFHKNYALASFIMYLGGPIATMIYGPMAQFLMDVYGWRGAMLLLGGLGCNLLWAGLLVKRPKGVYTSIPNENPQKSGCPDVHPSAHQPTIQNAGRWIASALGLDIFLNGKFVIVAGARICYSIAVGGVLIYIIPNGLSVGLNPQEASYLTGAYGVGSTLGLVFGVLASHQRTLSELHVAAVLGALLSAIALNATPFISAFYGQMAIVGLFIGGIYFYVQILSVITRFLPFEDEKFMNVLGWLAFVSGLGMAAGDTLSGWLYNATRSFHGTFFTYSACMIFGMLLLFMDFLRSYFTSRAQTA